MALHKTSRKKIAPGPDAWSQFAHTYHVDAFDVLDPEERSRFNELANNPSTWLQEKDITIHPVDKGRHVFAVVFYRTLKDDKKPAPGDKLTPRELLEGDLDEDEAKDVDEE